MSRLPDRSQFVNPQRYTLGKNDILTIDGVDYRVSDQETEETRKYGHMLISLDQRQKPVSFTHQALAAKIAEGSYQFFPHALDPKHQNALMLAGLQETARATLASLSTKMRQRVYYRYAYCIAFLQEERLDFCCRTDENIAKSVSETFRLLNEEQSNGEWIVPPKPSVRSVWRWLHTLEANVIQIGPEEPWQTAYLPIALAPRYAVSAVRRSLIHPGIAEIIERTLPTYLQLERPSVASKWYEINDLVNRKKEIGLIPHDAWVPSETTLFRMIRSRFGEFEICARRFGEGKALARYHAKAPQQEFYRPNELVYIDDWEVHLHTKISAEALAVLPPDIRARIKTERLNLCGAVDVSSGVNKGFVLSSGPSEEGVLRVIRLAYTDQTPWLRALGAQNPYSYAGQVKQFCADNGPTVFTPKVQASIADMGSTIAAGPSRTPHLRGDIEALFRKIDVKLMQHLWGRSFQNPLDRGEYEAEGRACLTLEDFLEVLAIWMMDVLNFQAVETRFGEVPHDTWLRLSAAYAPAPPPDKHRIRHVFGTDDTRMLTQEGVHVMHNNYIGPDLHRLHKELGDTEVQVRIDEFDIGWVSVRDPRTGAWLNGVAHRRYLDGVPLDHWVKTLEFLRDKHAKAATIYNAMVRHALDRIKEINRIAAAQNVYTKKRMTPEKLRALEARLAIGLKLSSDADRSDGSPPKDLLERAHRVVPKQSAGSKSDVEPSANRKKYTIRGVQDE